MAIKVGNKGVANIFIGSTPVKSVYKGNTKIWASESWHTIFDTERTWEGYFTTSAPRVFASTTNESKKFRITYKCTGNSITVYQHESRSSGTEYTDTFEISDTGNVLMLQASNYNPMSGAKSEVGIYYNVSTKEFTDQLKKSGNGNSAFITIYKIEQLY